jgi:hypothetical protein
MLGIPRLTDLHFSYDKFTNQTMATEDRIHSANNSITPGIYLISHIHWLNKIRKTIKDENIIIGINISTSILLCFYVEGMLYEILQAIIVKRKDETSDNSYLKLLDNITKRLEKANWTQYLEIWKVVLEKPLYSYTDNETWKGVQLLFNIRNIIVHGKNVNSKLLFKDNKFEIEYMGIFETAVDYFKERKIIKKRQVNSSTHKIFSTQTTNHFVKLIDKFIDNIMMEEFKTHKIDSIHLTIFHKDSLLLSLGIKPPTTGDKKRGDGLPF